MSESDFKGYPYKYSNVQIRESLDKYSERLMLGSSEMVKLTSLINLGLTELNSRSNKRATWISLTLSGLSIFIACTALLISLTTSHSSKRWEKNQLEVLKEISTKMDSQLNVKEDISQMR